MLGTEELRSALRRHVLEMADLAGTMIINNIIVQQAALEISRKRRYCILCRYQRQRIMLTLAGALQISRKLGVECVKATEECLCIQQ